MFFTKSFGYAVRGILYVTLMSDEKKRVQIDEIAERLSVPKHFLGKIMNKIVKEKILDSTKGPYGGFSINKDTLSVPLIKVLEVTEGLEQFSICALGLRKCDPEHPCPIHKEMIRLRTELKSTLIDTSINDLVIGNKPELIRNISAY
ncbi:MAG: Rrf2 family transcriptional regulator [Bacteroidetes bacterium]|nr:Rrf2 family transcriptional regulator [Bacteroidota bacterium]MBS1931226.1 Rrf2 family transcriptional regulator [Bacteroidota bacterium]